MTDPVVATMLRRLDLAGETIYGRPFVSAASGLATLGGTFVVALDDAHHVACFPADGAGRLVRVMDGDLPLDPAERKRRKPDFEAIATMPPASGRPDGGLLLVGSGSTGGRERMAIWPADGDGLAAGPPTLCSPAALYATLREACGGEINIEAAFFSDDDLVLISRAHGGRPVNHVAVIAADAIEPVLRGDAAATEKPRAVWPLVLGSISGVPLGVTDAAPLADGGWIFSAVAEDTTDSYNDGALVGSALGIVDRAGTVTRLSPLEPTVKVEGIVASEVDGLIEVTMVTDADDPEIPAAMLRLTIAAPAS